MEVNSALIITSISEANAAMQAFASGCGKSGMDFIVIGDSKSPDGFHLDGCRYFGLKEQRELPFRLARLLPERNYARKNLGYLIAKERSVILETDDDNLPLDAFWRKDLEPASVRRIDHKGWVNAYRYFSKENIWPRGYPLEKLGEKSPESTSGTLSREVKIFQGLADENPDVDAIYRLTYKLPFRFENNLPVVLESGAWCPFNSQNTAWKKEAFTLMYLPSWCSFRMTDIWRSFVAQRIAWTCDWKILFHGPDVWQERNAHDLLKDFEDEIPGYLYNSAIVRSLEDLDLKTGQENLSENLMRCYRMMVENSWIGKEEMQLVEAWCKEF